MPATRTAPATTRAASHAATRMRVVLAEDHAELRRLMADALRARGLEVIEVASGGGLLETLGSCLLGHLPLPDLVLSDQRMPGGTGLAILEGLRRSGWTVPFVLVTAFGDLELHARAERLGASVVDKPFDATTLAERVLVQCVVRHIQRQVPDWPGPADLVVPPG